jgi:hypothetical protein
VSFPILRGLLIHICFLPPVVGKYTEKLAREYGGNDYHQPIHRLKVDGYAVQHPGKPVRQAIQSVAVHLISLYYVLEVLPFLTGKLWASKDKRLRRYL